MLFEELGDIDPSSGEDLFDGGGLADVPIEVSREEGWTIEMLSLLIEKPGFQDLFGEGICIGMVGSSGDTVNDGTPPWDVGLNEDVKTL